MQRYHVNNSIKRELGSKLGSAKQVAAWILWHCSFNERAFAQCKKRCSGSQWTMSFATAA